MGEPNDERRPDSLSPIALEKQGDEADLRAMHKSNRFRIAGLVVVLLLAVGGSTAFLRGLDEKGVFREAGKTVNSIKKTEFDRFWGCALPNVDLREIKSNADLIARIRQRSRGNSVSYARQVRDRCLDILLGAETRLEPDLFPADLREMVKGMKESTVKVREAWSKYVSYLTNPSTEFSESTAANLETSIAEGWYGFLKAHSRINGLLRAKLK